MSDELSFAPEQNDLGMDDVRPWKLLVVDDDEEVHRSTAFALKRLWYDNRPLSLLHAYGGTEALDVLSKEEDVATVLLDVVMETDDAGLQTARRIRTELHNRLVRIVLRTGQPGQAPERRVVLDYDINDYKEKSELTAARLFTTVITALRGYTDLLTIERNRAGLTRIVNASANLFAYRNIGEFAQGVLMQITAILKVSDGSLANMASGLTASSETGEDTLRIVSGTGVFESRIGENLEHVVEGENLELIRESVRERKSFFRRNRFVGYLSTRTGIRSVLFIVGRRELEEIDRQLLLTFFSNISVAFENLYLHNEMRNSQLAIIETLGEVIDHRSHEVAAHTRRIGVLAARLGELVGMRPEIVDLLRIAAPMHDVGKVGIPDSILTKTGSLSSEEWQVMQKHTELGHRMFAGRHGQLERMIAEITLQHHEKWDGSGYPNGLREQQISRTARITGIVDAFDALRSERSYKDAWTPEQIAAELREQRGISFDPELVDVLLTHLEGFLELHGQL